MTHSHRRVYAFTKASRTRYLKKHAVSDVVCPYCKRVIFIGEKVKVQGSDARRYFHASCYQKLFVEA